MAVQPDLAMTMSMAVHAWWVFSRDTATGTTTTPVYYSFACFISTSIWIVFCHGNSTDITELDTTHTHLSQDVRSPVHHFLVNVVQWEKTKYIYILFLGRSTSFWLGSTLIFDAEEMLHHNRKPCSQSVLCLLKFKRQTHIDTLIIYLWSFWHCLPLVSLFCFQIDFLILTLCAFQPG